MCLSWCGIVEALSHLLLNLELTSLASCNQVLLHDSQQHLLHATTLAAQYTAEHQYYGSYSAAIACRQS